MGVLTCLLTTDSLPTHYLHRYEWASGVDGVGYYRLPSAPLPADPRAQSLLVLREAADAGAEFVRCAEFVGAVVGYDYRDGADGFGYYRVDTAAESRLLLREAAAAGADFVRCPEDVGKVPGYIFATGADGAVGYYRQPDAPPPDPYEYMSIVLQRASAAGAGFVACPNYVKELPGYRRAFFPMWGRQGRPGQAGNCITSARRLAHPSPLLSPFDHSSTTCLPWLGVCRYTDGPDGRGYYLQQQQSVVSADYDDFEKEMRAMGAV